MFFFQQGKGKSSEGNEGRQEIARREMLRKAKNVKTDRMRDAEIHP